MPISGTLTKAHINDAVSERNGFTLESWEDVLISSLDKFRVKKKRKGIKI